MGQSTETGRAQSPGLKWRSRANGGDVPYWFASPQAIAAGYPVKSANLSQCAETPALLLARAERLQAEMLRWLNGQTTRKIVQNGTFLPLFELYECEKESSYRDLKPGPQKAYDVYLRRLKSHIGAKRIDLADGRDVKRWFAEWRAGENGADHLPRARMALAVLKAAVKFGVICRVLGAASFQSILRELEFEAPASRKFAPTSEQVIAARLAAHAHGAPERALVYSLQHETQTRQWDLIGQWFELNDPRASAVLGYGMKWIGLEWKAIDENLILRLQPTKTEDTSEVSMTFDLTVCPMVMEDLAHFTDARRKGGPIVVNPKTGLPYPSHGFKRGWKKDFAAAGLPAGMWNRDLRAGGVTENRRAGARKDDVQKIAGHTQPKTTEIYDRETVEAHRRTMAARKAFNAKNAS
jgi:integrase